MKFAPFPMLGWVAVLATWLVAVRTVAQVPPLVHHQGRLAVGTSLFDGEGRFKFALINATASLVFWRNAPDTDANGEPDVAVTLPVQRGLYAVDLGDTTLANMAPLDAAVFGDPEVYLRVWFDDGVHGFERLIPDQRFAAVGYALVAATVPPGAIGSAQLAPGALNPIEAQIAALSSQLLALSNRIESVAAGQAVGLPSGVPVVSQAARDPTLLAQGFEPLLTQYAPGWVSGASFGAPSARFGHGAVWTGDELIVWGGNLSPFLLSGTGGRYRVSTDVWSPLPSFNPLTPRTRHGTVWTGSELVIWGGFAAEGYSDSGARYSPAGQTWTSLPIPGAPVGRDGHVMVWNGSRVAIWGGRNAGGFRSDGALYDPALNEWSPMNLPGAPSARHGALGVWTGNSILVWGGVTGVGPTATGGRLLFVGGVPTAWSALNVSGAPGPRSGHSGVWTGQRFIVWGGLAGTVLAGDGASYDPATDTWQPLNTTGAPSPRQKHSALWTGTEMIVFGGETASGAAADGFAYHPIRNVWRPLSDMGNPQARSEATAVWTGAELVVFGGKAGGQAVAALQRLVPQPTLFFYVKP